MMLISGYIRQVVKNLHDEKTETMSVALATLIFSLFYLVTSSS